MRHIQTIDQTLTLEIGYATEMSPESLTDVILEALESMSVVEEVGIVYIKATTPGKQLCAIDLWAPEADPNADVEPPEIPEQEDGQRKFN